MERKYYLRGLGLGILVTTIIMSVVLSGNRAMTNDEIIARAKELGLVENTVLSDTGSEDAEQKNAVNDRADVRDAADQSQEDLAAADTGSDIDSGAEADGDAIDITEGDDDSETDNAEQNDTDDSESESGDAVGEENPEPEAVVEEVQDNVTDLAEENGTESTNAAGTSATVRVITIISGDSSYTVAKKLADVGVVTSAETFDTFLCQNGYDKRLRTGNFSIPADASDEQIARIVTGLE